MLVAKQVALDLVRELRPLVEKIRKHDNNLAKQLVDAMNSTVQNLAEGEAHRGGNKRAKFDIALGEANEVSASLDLALAWGYIAGRFCGAPEATALARAVLGAHAHGLAGRNTRRAPRTNRRW